MSLITSVFLKHKICNSQFWDDEGYTFLCFALYLNDGRIFKGTISRDLYSIIERTDHEIRYQTLLTYKEYIEIESIDIIKEGLFALSKVVIKTSDGKIYRGKTDKGFARLISERI